MDEDELYNRIREKRLKANSVKVITRCKHCKFWDKDNKQSENVCFCPLLKMYINGEFFCANGKTR